MRLVGRLLDRLCAGLGSPQPVDRPVTPEIVEVRRRQAELAARIAAAERAAYRGALQGDSPPPR